MFAKRVYRVIMVVALAVLALPLGLSHSAQAQAKHVLKYQAAGEPAQLDPQIGSFTDGVAYDQAIFARLLRYDKDANPVPMMAKEVPTVANGGISADGKTYTYHLRNDWKWSDGKGVVKEGARRGVRLATPC
jgi:ABC-type transport system substrate-binding protein